MKGEDIELTRAELAKKLYEKKEADLSISIFVQTQIVEYDLSFYLNKRIIKQIKARNIDSFKVLSDLKAELKFLVDRYGKI